MTIKYNVPGNKRKELVKTIATWLGAEIKYCGAPTFAYEVDYFTIDRNGGLSFEDRADSEVIERLLEHLYDEGFECEEAPQNEQPAEATEPDDDTYDLNINLPRSLFTDAAIENLQKLVKGKESLLKKALGTDAVPVIVTEDTVEFPWFNGITSTDEHDAYLHLVTAIAQMARDQKRISVQDKEVDNEKYAFRCFLLRLGFIGDEFKWQRKFLLRNLSGSSAFKSGKAKEYKVELDDDNFKIFTAKNDAEADGLGMKIAEDLGSEFCDVSEVKD